MLLKWLLGQEFPGNPVGAYTAGAPGSILDWGSSFESQPKKKSLGRGFYSMQANRTQAAMGISWCLSLPRSCPFPRILLCVRASPPPLSVQLHHSAGEDAGKQ